MNHQYTLNTMTTIWHVAGTPTNTARDIVVMYTTGESVVTSWVDEMSENRTDLIVGWAYLPKVKRVTT